MPRRETRAVQPLERREREDTSVPTLVEQLDAMSDSLERNEEKARSRREELERGITVEGRYAEAILKSAAASSSTIQAPIKPGGPTVIDLGHVDPRTGNEATYTLPNFLPMGEGQGGQPSGPGGSSGGQVAPGGQPSAPGSATAPPPPTQPPVTIDLGRIDPRTGKESTYNLPIFLPMGEKSGGGDSSSPTDPSGSQAAPAVPPNTPKIPPIDLGRIDPRTGQEATYTMPNLAPIGMVYRPSPLNLAPSPGGPASPTNLTGTRTAAGVVGNDPRFPNIPSITSPVGRVGNDPRFPLIPSAPNPATGKFSGASTSVGPTSGEKAIVTGLKDVVTAIKSLNRRGTNNEFRAKGLLS